MITYIEKSKEIYKKAIGTNTEFSKAAGYSINIQKLVLLIYKSIKTRNLNFKNMIYNSTKNMKYLGINPTKDEKTCTLNSNYKTQPR